MYGLTSGIKSLNFSSDNASRKLSASSTSAKTCGAQLQGADHGITSFRVRKTAEESEILIKGMYF